MPVLAKNCTFKTGSNRGGWGYVDHSARIHGCGIFSQEVWETSIKKNINDAVHLDKLSPPQKKRYLPESDYGNEAVRPGKKKVMKPPHEEGHVR